MKLSTRPKASRHNEVFWDTSGFFALLNSDDPAHERDKTLLAEFAVHRTRSVTSDWIIGETCTLLIMRKRGHLVLRFLATIDTSQSIQIVHVDPDVFQHSRGFLSRRWERAYSFTDCTSFVLMKSLKLQAAVTGDEHFTDEGFKALLREEHSSPRKRKRRS